MIVSNVVLEAIERIAYYDGPYVGAAGNKHGEWWFQPIYGDWHLRYRAIGFFAPPLLRLAHFAWIEAAREISSAADPKSWSDEFFALAGRLLASSEFGGFYERACASFGRRTMGLHMTVEELFAAGEVNLQMVTIDRVTTEEDGFRVLVPESEAEMRWLHEPTNWHPGGEALKLLAVDDYPSVLFDESKRTDMSAPDLYDGPL